MTPVLVASALLLAAAALRVALARRRAPPLPPPHPVPPPTAVLLPVRDEAENVDACVESLVAQCARTRLRVIDDGSTDATPRHLAALRAAHAGLELLAARPLPAGWGGKVNALETGRTGLPALTEPWLLLTDADTRHAPDLLARAHAAADEHRLDALSLSGLQVAGSAGEALLVPAVFALLDCLLGDWRPHARGEASSPVANGQFFLLRREALERIGGFAAIAGRALDDVELARALAAAGFRVGFRRAGGALRVRMYPGGAAAFAGWRRNLALFLAPRPATALLAAALLLLPALALAVALATGDLPSAAAIWALCAIASLLVRPGGQRIAALLAPLDAFLLGALLLTASIDRARGRRAPWRGREVALIHAPEGKETKRP
jgi:chlorobactene glucosyltransferase